MKVNNISAYWGALSSHHEMIKWTRFRGELILCVRQVIDILEKTIMENLCERDTLADQNVGGMLM